MEEENKEAKQQEWQAAPQSEAANASLQEEQPAQQPVQGAAPQPITQAAQQSYQQLYQQPYQQPVPQMQPPVMPQTELGMTWTIVYRVFLMISAVSNLSSAVSYFSGSVWEMSGVKLKVAYSALPNLQGASIAMGIACLLVAGICIATFVLLCTKHKLAPIFGTWEPLATGGISVIGNFILFMALQGTALMKAALTNINISFGNGFVSTVTATTIASMIIVLITSIVLTIINKIYFGKRKHLYTK